MIKELDVKISKNDSAIEQYNNQNYIVGELVVDLNNNAGDLNYEFDKVDYYGFMDKTMLSSINVFDDFEMIFMNNNAIHKSENWIYGLSVILLFPTLIFGLGVLSELFVLNITSAINALLGFIAFFSVMYALSNMLFCMKRDFLINHRGKLLTLKEREVLSLFIKNVKEEYVKRGYANDFLIKNYDGGYTKPTSNDLVKHIVYAFFKHADNDYLKGKIHQVIYDMDLFNKVYIQYLNQGIDVFEDSDGKQYLLEHNIDIENIFNTITYSIDDTQSYSEINSVLKIFNKMNNCNDDFLKKIKVLSIMNVETNNVDNSIMKKYFNLLEKEVKAIQFFYEKNPHISQMNIQQYLKYDKENYLVNEQEYYDVIEKIINGLKQHKRNLQSIVKNK